MTVNLEDSVVILTGACGVEEVDTLVTYLQSRTDLSVDLSAATTMHTALWQALMTFRPNLVAATSPSLMEERLLLGLAIYLDQTGEFGA